MTKPCATRESCGVEKRDLAMHQRVCTLGRCKVANEDFCDCKVSAGWIREMLSRALAAEAELKTRDERRCETCGDAAEVSDPSEIECQSTVPGCPVRWMVLPISFSCPHWTAKGGCDNDNV